MLDTVDSKISHGDLSKIDNEGFYNDPLDSDMTDEEKLASGDGYIRECAEIQRLLDKYMVAANERLRATVKVYDCGEYSQEFLQSLIVK
ncbi:MAG: hypothetical protein IMZ43_12290 [Thermoplasmata archaeon]|nr:hypothetical protein [Thermoplasmata archaeon]